MARNTINQDFYERLTQAYREAPGNVSRASKVAKCDRRTARRGWNEGWKDRGFSPICEILKDEQSAARARIQANRVSEMSVLKERQQRRIEDTQTLAMEDAIESRAETAKVVRAARSNAMGLMVVTQRMLKAAAKLSEKMETALSESTIKPERAVTLFKEIASTAKAANETGKIALAMEKSLLGEPEKIIGHKVVPDMSPSEAAREIELSNKALDRMREQGLLIDADAPADGEPAQA